MKKEKPILFSTPMVQAVLNGTKTQTRRVVKPQPILDEGSGYLFDGKHNKLYDGYNWKERFIQDFSPYGKVGDELWVRETWQALRFFYDFETGLCDEIKAINHKEVNPIDLKSFIINPKTGFVYAADPHEGNVEDRGFSWKPSIHMPRIASRIQLRITDIRVERLQDISESDAVREGITDTNTNHPLITYKDYLCEGNSLDAVDSFRSLWDSINGEPRKDGVDISWNSNPWVWVVEFEKIKP